MNARQKAKKYKKELERYKYNTSCPRIVYDYPVKPITIGASKLVSNEALLAISLNNVEDFVKDELIHMICDDPAFQEALLIEYVSDDFLQIKDFRAYLTVLPGTRVAM